MSTRPDLVECWVFRLGTADDDAEPRVGPSVEVLLLRRAAHRIFPGLWQCVTGGVEPDERVPGAALREVREETGLAGDDIEAVYDLDLAVPFYDEGSDGVITSAIFAVRVRATASPRISHEHDAMRWVSAADAPAAVVWPSYAEAVRRVADLLADPARERWFRLDDDLRRLARQPAG